VETGFFGQGVADTEGLEGQIDEPRRGRFGIFLQGIEAGQRLLDKVLLPRIDQPVKMSSRQTVCPDRSGQRFDDGVAAHRPALEGGGDILAPPLQSNLAEHRLADRFAHPGNLVVERVKREQRFASPGRGEYCGLEAVVVVTMNQSGDRGKAPRSGGTAFPFRRFPVN